MARLLCMHGMRAFSISDSGRGGEHWRVPVLLQDHACVVGPQLRALLRLSHRGVRVCFADAWCGHRLRGCGACLRWLRLHGLTGAPEPEVHVRERSCSESAAAGTTLRTAWRSAR